MTLPSSTRLLTALAALSLVLAGCAGSSDVGAADLPAQGDPNSSAMCAEDTPDCDDMVAGDEALVDPAEGGAAGSCLEGDDGCTDESTGGQDVARIIDRSDERSGAKQIARGTTAGASGRFIEQVGVLDDETLLEITFTGGACDLVEDVLVTESDTEVRLLVLSAQDATVEMCTAEVVSWAIDVTLDAPLGERTLTDLSG